MMTAPVTAYKLWFLPETLESLRVRCGPALGGSEKLPSGLHTAFLAGVRIYDSGRELWNFNDMLRREYVLARLGYRVDRNGQINPLAVIYGNQKPPLLFLVDSDGYRSSSDVFSVVTIPPQGRPLSLEEFVLAAHGEYDRPSVGFHRGLKDAANGRHLICYEPAHVLLSARITGEIMAARLPGLLASGLS